jgi:shikimate kinase/3-dehydroquinate synthase
MRDARPGVIVLSGFMATGKTTVGRLVASALGVPFVDTDALLAEAAGIPVGELFARDGEARFREREAELVLPMLEDATPRVIAFGGGTVTIPRVRYAALEAATVVTLTAPPDAVVARAGAVADRPNLATRSPAERAADLLALRAPIYAECHGRVRTEGRSPEAVAEDVLRIARLDALAVPLRERSYRVELADGEPGLLTQALDDLAPSSIVVVTDTNVRAARGAWLDAALAGRRALTIEIPAGEASKTLSTVARIWDEALASGVDRDAVVVAFGGGVPGDLAGFAAATLLRGVRCVQIATSLLAMVDSSVGGKTGFDHAAGKNLIGAFFQPSRVVVDLEHLATLPARERACGLAEIVKIALAREPLLLEALERSADALARGDRAALRPVVREAIAAKIRVVRDDEREAGVRALLNLGHTVGHALEAAGGYASHLHGEGVAIGTVLELEATERMGLTPAGTAERAEALLARLGLPTRVPREELHAAWPFVQSDKKRAGTTVKLPVVTGAGEARVVSVEIERLRAALLG